jgi:hypothetical protein
LHRTPTGERGSSVGLLSAFCDMFVGLSAFAAGAVQAVFGYSAAFVMASAALGGGACMGRFVFVGKLEHKVYVV